MATIEMVNTPDKFIIDDDFYSYLKQFKWKISQGYPACKNGKVYRIIVENLCGMYVPKGMHIDHINRNRLDNRIDNLRIVDPTINHLNKTTNTGERLYYIKPPILTMG